MEHDLRSNKAKCGKSNSANFAHYAEARNTCYHLVIACLSKSALYRSISLLNILISGLCVSFFLFSFFLFFFLFLFSFSFFFFFFLFFLFFSFFSFSFFFKTFLKLVLLHLHSSSIVQFLFKECQLLVFRSILNPANDLEFNFSSFLMLLDC